MMSRITGVISAYLVFGAVTLGGEAFLLLPMATAASEAAGA